MNNNKISYQKFVDILEKSISSGDFYWQSIALIIGFGISSLLYFFIKRKLLPKMMNEGKLNSDFINIFENYIIPLFYPALSVISLAIVLAVYSQIEENVIFISTILKLATLLLFLRILRAISNSAIIVNFAGICLIPATILDIFGILNPAISYLDQYALDIGKFRISVYIVIKSLVILTIVFLLLNLMRKKAKILIENSSSIEVSTRSLIIKFIDIFTYFALAVISLKTIGIDMTAFTVIGGAVGVGIGLGLQKIASNFIGGIILLFEKAIEVGDWIEIENGNIFGIVKHFAGRYTIVEGFDGREIIIPNEDLIVNKVINWTYSNNRARIEINIGVAYNSDLNKVRQIMIDVANSNSRCLQYPEVECNLINFGEFDIKFLLTFWINDIVEGRQSAKSQVMLEIWQKFKENNIEIPLPQREVKVINTKL